MKKFSVYVAFLSVMMALCFVGGGCSLISVLTNMEDEYTDSQEKDSDDKEDDVTNSVEITPRGMQTVIVGKEYEFTANALRKSGSIITGKSVTQRKTFTETGRHTFSMTVDGISAETTVNVIEDDITLPVEYMGKTYNGIDTSTITGSVKNKCPDKTIRKLEVTYPDGNLFDADGFFPLKLNVNNPGMYQFVTIRISGGTNDKEESYTYRGNPNSDSGELETRIWLRWGKGSYTVEICDLTYVKWKYQAVDDTTSTDGKVTYYGDNFLSYYKYYPSVTFTVENTRDEDGTFLYPSSVVQCDDIVIMNKAADLTAGFTKTEDKIKAIHDWIVKSKYYDQDSASSNTRKRQDAVAVMEYGMCVCEGYANLTAALLRNCEIQVKVVSSKSLNHVWNHVNVGSETNEDWRLLDTCWDDPLIEDRFGNKHDGGPDFVTYKNYLLTDLEDGAKPHTGGVPDIWREAIYSGVGHIDGVESIAY